MTTNEKNAIESKIQGIKKELGDNVHDMNTDLSQTAALLRTIFLRLDKAAENYNPLDDDKKIVEDARDVIATSLRIMPVAFEDKYYERFDQMNTELERLCITLQVN